MTFLRLLTFSAVFTRAEHSVLFLFSMALHSCDSPLPCLASFSHQSSFKSWYFSQWCVYKLFSWLHTLSVSFYYQLYANDLQIYVCNSCLFHELKNNVLSCLLDISPWIYHKYLKIDTSKTKLLIQFPYPVFSNVLCLHNSTISCYKLETLEVIFLLPYQPHPNQCQELLIPLSKFL